MALIEESKLIAGVHLAQLRAHGDERGCFIETFRKEWFPQRSWAIIQSNRADSIAGVLRGLHYHHHQVDYWYVLRGRLRVGLYDLRPASPTFGAGQIIELSGHLPRGLFIPVGVAHGYLALTEVTLTYLVDNYYDGRDENGVAWNDPDIGLDWGTDSPMVSQRDAANPPLRDIAAANLPVYEEA
jgi:dTDP-4-dehydrorhamnose 3,5-epimerase